MCLPLAPGPGGWVGGGKRERARERHSLPVTLPPPPPSVAELIESETPPLIHSPSSKRSSHTNWKIISLVECNVAPLQFSILLLKISFRSCSFYAPLIAWFLRAAYFCVVVFLAYSRHKTLTPVFVAFTVIQSWMAHTSAWWELMLTATWFWQFCTMLLTVTVIVFTSIPAPI